jgi:hypothetical protein
VSDQQPDTGANPVSGRRFVLAEDQRGIRIAVGPVFKDESEAKLREQIQIVGWKVIETIAQLSAGDFRSNALREVVDGIQERQGGQS